MASREGEQLGNYRLERLLGRGGFAEVYLGEHVYLKTPAAIKLLHTTEADQKHLEGFLREAQAIAKLVHPHIVRVLEFGLDGETAFLVMDYASNGTLRQRYPRKTQLSLTTILPYVKQVSVALQYAHDAKIIHRDVKPENMLLGRGDEVLLSDFGVALLAHSSSSLSLQEVAGTAAYMAPEQFQGKPRFASDQYALGLVVYEWLTGDLPFHGSFIELGTQHLFTAPAPLHEKVPMISSGVEDVILRALAKAPQDRYASVEEFAKELERAAGSSHSASVTAAELPLLPTIPGFHQEASPHIPRRIVLKPVLVSSHPASMTIAELPLALITLRAHQETSPRIPRPVQVGTDEPGTSQGFFGKTAYADTSGQIPVPDVQRHTPSVQRSLMPATRWRKRRVMPITLTSLVLLFVVTGLLWFNRVPLNPAGGGRSITPPPSATSIQISQIQDSQRGGGSIISSTSATGEPAPALYGVKGQLVLDNPLNNNQTSGSWHLTKANKLTGCHITNGAYDIKELDNEYCLADEPSSLTDFVYQIDMTIIQGPQAGIVFRVIDNQQFYYDFEVGVDGSYRLYRSDPTPDVYDPIILQGTSPAIQKGYNRLNQLAVKAIGPRIFLYVNSQLVGETQDSNYSIGNVGVRIVDEDGKAIHGRGYSEASYRNAKVWAWM